MLLERGEPGHLYNLCPGWSWAIQQVLYFYVEHSHTYGIAVKIDPERLCPSDVMVLEGDSSKIRRCLGWQAEIPFRAYAEGSARVLASACRVIAALSLAGPKNQLSAHTAPCPYFKLSSRLRPFRRTLRACWRRSGPLWHSACRRPALSYSFSRPRIGHLLAHLGRHGGTIRDTFQIRGWSGTLIPKHYMIVQDPNLNGARCPMPSCATAGQAARRLTFNPKGLEGNHNSRADGLVPASPKPYHGT
jgi:hypothetical protein